MGKQAKRSWSSSSRSWIKERREGGRESVRSLPGVCRRSCAKINNRRTMATCRRRRSCSTGNASNLNKWRSKAHTVEGYTRVGGRWNWLRWQRVCLWSRWMQGEVQITTMWLPSRSCCSAQRNVGGGCNCFHHQWIRHTHRLTHTHTSTEVCVCACVWSWFPVGLGWLPKTHSTSQTIFKFCAQTPRSASHQQQGRVEIGTRGGGVAPEVASWH